jgi:acetylornithine deacetylase/succinyl-diaminopimelate desuccinylase-like protein/uncharacterized protein YdeI (YjbR/CyaY-like superfamily)
MEITETVYIPTRKGWRAWLARHHKTKTQIWFTYYKKASGKQTVAYAEAVEEALCYGWIDGLVKTIDSERWVQRFTPRKKGSNWSGPNLERVRRLTESGQMTPAGAAHVPTAKESRAWQATHDGRRAAPTEAPKDLAAALRKNKKASDFWKSLAPSYRRLYGRMVTEAKKEETRVKRIAKLMLRLERGVKHPLDKVPPILLAIALAANTALAQGFDQKAMGRAVFKELIETNTTPSSGNTTKAAELIAARFRDAGIPAVDIAIVGPDETHKNLVVRIRGADATRRPILFLAHLDVVEAEKKDWTMDPFVFNEVDGFYYGRGTQDIKGGATTLITSLLRLKAEGQTPSRDFVLALTAGEEGGMPNGVEWLLANRKDLIDAEFCVNVDGGGVDSEKGVPAVLNMQAAEKVYFDVTLTVKNKGGHSSLPRPDNAINALARALVKISAHTFPVQFNEITRAYFQRSAAVRGGQLGKDLKSASSTPADQAAIARLSKDAWFNAQMRTTCIATLLKGGHAPNALPQEAAANVNCRRLPGLRSDSLVRLLKKVVNDTNVEFTVASDSPQSPASPLRADIEAMVRNASEAIAPKLPLIPVMETGATDGLFFRNAGIPTYGLSGIAIDTDDVRMHGQNERVNIVAFERAQEFIYRLIKQLGARQVTP